MASGRKTGGRQAGTPNASTLTLREQVEQAAGGPLPVLLATLGRQAMDKGDAHIAVTAYAKAATYVYPRQQAVTVTDTTPIIYPPLLVDERGMAKIPDDYPGMTIRFQGPTPNGEYDPDEVENDPNTYVVKFKG
jgi:hypothetical protein